jgi:uncharacterized membrane protein
MLGNLVIVILFAVTAWLRSSKANFVPNGLARLLSSTGLALTLSFIGIILALITLWIGGELVYHKFGMLQKNAAVICSGD